MANETELVVNIKGKDSTRAATNSVADGINRLGQIIGSSVALTKLKDGINSAIQASIKFENSMIGVATVARAFDQDVGATTQAAKELASDGLMSVAESATALKNLLATGFALPEAIQLMNTFKDAASFNRQGTLAFGEAIVGATIGIKNQNSIMVDNVGISKNLSNILQEQGLSVKDLGLVTSDTAVRQKLLNGLLREGSIHAGDAARLSQTLGGQQARLDTILFNLKARLGDILRVGYQPLIQNTVNWLQENPKLITSLIIAGGAATAFAATLVGLRSAILLVQAAAAPVTIVLLALSAVVGGVVFNAMNRLQDKMTATAGTVASDTKQMANDAKKNLSGGVGKQASDTAKQIAKIDEQMRQTQRNFRESLAKIVTDHQDKVRQLEAQIAEEKGDFEESNKDRALTFKRRQEEMTIDHDRKVKDIQAQIDEETAKGKSADEKRLADLRLRLARENEDFTRHFAQMDEDYKVDTENAKREQDAKTAALEAELAREREFLQRHNDAITEIKGVQLLDEIELLRRSHGEQMTEYEAQRVNVLSKVRETTSGVTQAYESQIDALSGTGETIGMMMGSSLKDAFMQVVREMIDEAKSIIAKTFTMKNLKESIGAVGDWAAAGTSKLESLQMNQKLRAKAEDKYMAGDKDMAARLLKTAGITTPVDDYFAYTKSPGYISPFADGGEFDAGKPMIVGERGPEIMVPKRAGVVIPNEQLTAGMGGQVTINNTNYFYSESDPLIMAREQAFQLGVR